MKVLLRRNVPKLGIIGDVVDVKMGYARNYLIPEGLAIKPTRENVRAVDLDKARYLEELAKQKAQIEAKAAVVNGKAITIAARANEEGHLYGSVGPAQIAAALAEKSLFVEAETIALAEPIRQVGECEILIEFGQEITATITCSVVAISDTEGGAGSAEPQQAAE